MKTKIKITVSAMFTFIITLAFVVFTARNTKEPLADTHNINANIVLTESENLASPMQLTEVFMNEPVMSVNSGVVALYNVEVSTEEEPSTETIAVIEEPVITTTEAPAETTEAPATTTETTEASTETPAETTPAGTRSLGMFTITAYCGCSQCCGAYAEGRGDVVTGALGVPLIGNYSIAVDPNVIAFYSTVYINGAPYVAHDTGGAIQGNRIDIYMDNHQDALNWGVRTVEVFY